MGDFTYNCLLNVHAHKRPGRPDLYFASVTPREREILRHLAHGLLNKEIGYSLGIAVSTVKGHIAEIMHKGHFGNRVQIARWVLLNPAIYDKECMVELQMHARGCPCDHPYCVGVRALDLVA